MAKKISLFLLVVLLLLFLLAGAAYLTRIELVKWAFNEAMADSDVQLEELHGLSLGLSGIRIDKVALRVGANASRQQFPHLTVRYRWADIAVEAIHVREANLEQPEFVGADRAEKQLSISNFLGLAAALPFESLRVDKLTIGDVFDSGRAGWRKADGSGVLQLGSGDYGWTLTLSDLSDKGASVLLQSNHGQRPIAQVQMALHRQPADYHLTVKGNLVIERFVSLLSRYLALPARTENMAGTFNFEMSGSVPDRPAGSLSMNIAPSTALNISYGDDGIALLPVQASAQIRLLKESVLNVRLPNGGQEKAVRLGLSVPELSAILREPNHQLESVVSMADLNCRWEGSALCESDISWNLTSAGLTYQGNELKGLEAKLESHLRLDSDGLIAEIQPGPLLRVGSLSDGEIEIAGLSAAAESPLRLAHDFLSARTQLTQRQMVINLPMVRIPVSGGTAEGSATFDVKDLQLINRDGLNVQAKLNARDLNMQMPGYWLPGFGFNATISLHGRKFTADGQLASDRARALAEFSVSHDLTVNGGSAVLTATDIVFDGGENKLSDFFVEWKPKMDIRSGRFQLRAHLDWHNTEEGIVIDGSVKPQLKSVSGFYRDTVFVDLNTAIDAEIQGVGDIVSVKPSQFTVASLDLGVPVSNIKTTFSIDTGREIYRLHRFEADLLGGRVIADSFVYGQNRDENSITIDLEAIDIGEIFALANFEGVECSGFISGRLPVLLTKDGLAVEQGTIDSVDPGGVFRYTLSDAPTEELSLTGDIQTQLVNRILSNYHYHSLQATAEYSYRRDQLKLQVKMRGQNPDIEGGLAANFNPSIETSILPILRAHLASQSVIERLESRLAGD